MIVIEKDTLHQLVTFTDGCAHVPMYPHPYVHLCICNVYYTHVKERVGYLGHFLALPHQCLYFKPSIRVIWGPFLKIWILRLVDQYFSITEGGTSVWVFSTAYLIFPTGSQVWGPPLGDDKSGSSVGSLLDYNS